MKEESWLFFLCHGEGDRGGINSERDNGGAVGVGKKTVSSVRDKRNILQSTYPLGVNDVMLPLIIKLHELSV